MDNKAAKQRILDLLAQLEETAESPDDAPTGLGGYQGPLVAQLLVVAGAQDAVLDQHRPARVPAGLKKAALKLQDALLNIHRQVGVEHPELGDDESHTALEIMLDWTDALTRRPWRREAGRDQVAIEALRGQLAALEAADDSSGRRDIYELGASSVNTEDLLVGPRAVVVELLSRLRARAGRDLGEIPDASDWADVCDEALDRLGVAAVPESLSTEPVSVRRAVSLVKRKQVDVLLRWAGDQGGDEVALVRAAALLLAGEHEDAARAAAQAGERPGALRVQTLALAVSGREPWAALGAFLASTVSGSQVYDQDMLGEALIDRLGKQLEPLEFWEAVLSPQPQMHLPFAWVGGERYVATGNFFAELTPREQAYLWCARAALDLGSSPLRAEQVEHALEQAHATGAECPLVQTLRDELEALAAR